MTPFLKNYGIGVDFLLFFQAIVLFDEFLNDQSGLGEILGDPKKMKKNF